MDSYTPLLEKNPYSQPSLKKYAVISIFSKLRFAPNYLDSDSEPGREAISQCLHSSSPAVVDQSVHELCGLVAAEDSRFDVRRGLLELQSALEGSDSKFVDLFVKFLVWLGFQKSNGDWSFTNTESHPFIKEFCRAEAMWRLNLCNKSYYLLVQNRQLGMVEVLETVFGEFFSVCEAFSASVASLLLN